MKMVATFGNHFYFMTILNDDELQQLCRSYTTRFIDYDYYAATFFYNIEASGCRPAEIHTPGLWSVDITGTYLQPLKGNNLRFFPLGTLSTDFRNDIENRNYWWESMSVDKWNYLVQKYNPYPKLYVGNKEINCGIFRHNRVRQMTANGDTQAFIVAAFGWQDASMYDVYQFGDIYYI